MHCQRTVGFLFLICFALWGCSGVQSPSRMVWTATPEIRTVDNQLFRASVEPRKGESPYYAFFLLTVKNRSDRDLVIDWNASRYLFNGKPQGLMVFQGIDPAAVKTETVPPETIAPGEVFSREIMPMRLIAWSPIKEKTSSDRSITPGMLPVGENGIRLAVQHKDGELAVPLSIRISSEGAP